jgi:hypothetical protein
MRASKTVFDDMFFISPCPAPSIGDADGKRRADCLSPLISGRVSARSGRINRAMLQASCCQARRQAKRGAQQSPDCEHPSEIGTHRNTYKEMRTPATRDNAAWRHKAPHHCPVWRRAGLSGTRACSFASFSVTGQKMKKLFQQSTPERSNLSGHSTRGGAFC